MLLILVDDVTNYLIAGPTHDVIILTTFTQKDFCPEVFSLVVFFIIHHEAGLHIGSGIDLIEKVMLLAMKYLETWHTFLFIKHDIAF